MEEVSAVRRIETLIAESMADASLAAKMRSDMCTLISDCRDAARVDSLLTSQQEYFADLGGIGTSEAVKFILEVLCG